MKQPRLLSLGTIYIDINCINFPFDKALFANRETTGNEYLLELGGSALNFAKIASKLQIQTTFIGKVGDDAMGKQLVHLFKENKINPAIVVDPHVQTNLAIHYIHPDGSSIMTSSGSANQNLTYENALLMMNMHAKHIDYLYLGGCFKLKQLLPSLPEIAKTAKEKGMQIVLDHGRINNTVSQEDITYIYNLLPFVDIYLPSIDEFFELWDVKDIDEGYAKVKKISKALVVIKQGDLGAVGFHNDKKIAIPAFPVQAINTVGAGDSFNAGLIKAHSNGTGLSECIQYACATAAAKITTDEFSLQSIKNILERI
jgi:ribokinase